jgi:hypothetical protein
MTRHVIWEFSKTKEQAMCRGSINFGFLVLHFAFTLPVYQEKLMGVNEGLSLLRVPAPSQ